MTPGLSGLALADVRRAFISHHYCVIHTATLLGPPQTQSGHHTERNGRPHDRANDLPHDAPSEVESIQPGRSPPEPHRV